MINVTTARDMRILVGLCSLMLHNARANKGCFVVPLGLRPYINAAVVSLFAGEYSGERTMSASRIAGFTAQDIAAAFLTPSKEAIKQMVPELPEAKSLAAGETFTTASKRKYSVITEFDIVSYRNASAREKTQMVAKALRAGAIQKIVA